MKLLPLVVTAAFVIMAIAWTWALAQGRQQVVADATDLPPVVIESVRADGLGCVTLLGLDFDVRCWLDRSSRAKN